MRTSFCRTVFALAVLLLVLHCVRLGAQPRDDWRAAVDRWLHSSCIADEERALTDALLRNRAAVARALEKALADGPPDDEIRKVLDAALERFAQRGKFEFDEYRIEGVSKEDLARFKRVSEAEYVEDQVRRFALGYRSNAIAGLGVVGGPDAYELLRRIAGDSKNPLAPAAEEALKKLRK